MSTCANCGVDNLDAAKFCKGCGTKITGGVTSAVDSVPPPGSKFCPQCSRPNPLAAVFCGTCGNSFSPKSATPVAAEASPAASAAPRPVAQPAPAAKPRPAPRTQAPAQDSSWLLQDQPPKQKSSTGKRAFIAIAIVALLGAMGGGGYWMYRNDFSMTSLTALVTKPAPKAPVPDDNPAPPISSAPSVAVPPVEPQPPAGKTEQQIRDEVMAEMQKAEGDAAAKAEADRNARTAAVKAKLEREKATAELEKAKADTTKAKADAEKAKAEAAAAVAAVTANKPTAPAAQAIRSPQDACADRPNFISREICLGRECERPEKYDLPFCRDRRARNQSNNPVGGSSAP